MFYAAVQLNDSTPGILMPESNIWTTEMWTEPSADYDTSRNSILTGGPDCVECFC